MIPNTPFVKEIRSLVSLAIPALLAQIAMVSMGFVDTVMTGRVGAVDMAAVALAGSLWVPLILLGQGLLLAVTPSAAQLRGSGNHARAGHLMRQGLWLSLMLSIPLMLVADFIADNLEYMGVTGDLARLTRQYLKFVIWGGPGYMLFAGMRCGLEGFALMRPAMFAGFLGLAFNVPVNYIFIFGKFGMPALGGPGTAVATAMVYWVMFLTMLLYAWRHQSIWKHLRPASWEKPALTTLKKLLLISFPGALATLFEVTLFAAVAVLLAPLGAIMVAGHQVALNFSSLLFMVPLSIGIAGTIRTGYCLGLKDPEAVCRARRSALSLAVFAAVVTAVLTYYLRGQIAAMYNDDPVVLSLASYLLIYAAAYQITDALQVVSVGILRGYNDTRAIFGITFAAYWIIGLPLGYSLGRTSLWGEPSGAEGFWIAFIVGISIAAVMLLYRIRVLERRLFVDPTRIRGLQRSL